MHKKILYCIKTNMIKFFKVKYAVKYKGIFQIKHLEN